MTALSDRGPVPLHPFAPAGKIRSSSKMPGDLRRLLESDRRLVLCGRNSQSNGRPGALAAAQDLHEAARDLKRNFGIDVLDCLPSIEELADALMAAPVEVSYDRFGKPFRNRYCLFEVLGFNLILSVSAGSARKVDREGRQPHAEHLRALMMRADLRVGGLYLKRFDRGVRDRWSAHRFLEPLQHMKEDGNPVWAARAHDAFRLDGSDDVQVLVDGMAAARDADDFAQKRINGAISGTTCSPDSDYRIKWAVTRPAPPGMMTYRDRKTGGLILTFDTPSLYPKKKQSLTLLPNVRFPRAEGDGGVKPERVDQVANVMWFWANLADLGLQACMEELTKRRYSTQTLRNQRENGGPKAYYGSAALPLHTPGRSWDAPTSWSRSLLDSFEFYCTGELHPPVGTDTLRISNVFPPAGYWMTAEAEAANREYLARRGVKRDRAPVRWSWSGLRVEVNGSPGRLTSPRDPEERPVRWPVVIDEAQGADQYFPALPDHVLTGAIIEGVIAAHGQPLTAALVDTADPEMEVLKAEQMVLNTKVAKTERDLATRHREIMATDEAGEFAMPRAFRVSAMSEWEADTTMLTADREQLQVLDARLAHSAQSAGISVSNLERAIAQLRDPASSDVRSMLRAAVQNIRLTSQPVRNGYLKGKHITVSGDLVISANGQDFAIPFAGDYTTGAITKSDNLVLEAARQLRAGSPLTGGGHKLPTSMMLLAKQLGVPPRQFSVRRCQDPDLLRIAMATLFPDPIDGERPDDVLSLEGLISDSTLLSQFGDIEGLAAQIRIVHAKYTGSQWLIKDGAPFEVQVILNAQNPATDGALTEAERTGIRHLRQQARQRPERYARWRFTTGARPVITPCAFCSERYCAPMRIREVTGFLCLSCRKDERGVLWPQRFNRYLSNVDLWIASGHVPPLDTPIADAVALAATPRHRPLDDLSPKELTLLASEYSNPEAHRMTVDQIAERFGISTATLYQAVYKLELGNRYAGVASKRKGLKS